MSMDIARANGATREAFIQALSSVIDHSIERLDRTRFKSKESEILFMRKAHIEIISLIRDAFIRRESIPEEFRSRIDEMIKSFCSKAVSDAVKLEVDRQICLTRKAEEDYVSAKNDYENAIRKYNEIIAADPVQRRMSAFISQIDSVLPISRNASAEQALRSRGLVLAALAGMKSVGSKFNAETEQKEETSA